MKLASWNVNGVRACMDKGLREYLRTCDADIVCMQEVKAEQHQAGLEWLEGYEVIWNPAAKKGYAGTAVLTRIPFKTHVLGFGIPDHDNEGRVISVELPDFHLVNVYTPNAQDGLRRLSYRLEWDEAFRNHLKNLEQSKPVLACGDLNVAHKEIDIARPNENRRSPGFSDQERESFSRLIDSGFVDTFRHFEPGPGHYSWWSYRAGARKRNVGWRIDYWLASEALRSRLRSSRIQCDVHGSDHCPVELEIE
jgi:exodeoxyribonuclease-3